MSDNHDPDPDIVDIILRACRAAGLDDGAAQLIEQSIRETHGGLRVRIPKRKKHLSQAERKQIFLDALTDIPEREITSKYKINRATLYRIMKKG